MFSEISPVAAIVFGVLGVALYLLPSLVAFNRGVHNRWLVLVINLVFGASLIGWLIALYLATRKAKEPAAAAA